MLKNNWFLVVILCFLNYESYAQQNIKTVDIAQTVLNKGLKEVNLEGYQGSLLLQGMAELALVNTDKKMLREIEAIYQKFGTSQIDGKGSFISYKAGGNGAAFLNYHKSTTKLNDQVVKAASQMFNNQKRAKEGILTANWASDQNEQVFIDMAFAVTPYMLYVGLRENKNEYVDLAVAETLELFRILHDSKTKLLHQARGFNGAGIISEDNWSRGNGWGALAIATLVRELPKNHPKRNEVEILAKEFFQAIIRHQNKAGLWHQEMTDKSSFIETSGSGLLLYGLGIMLDEGLLNKKYEANFIKGLTALAAYITKEGSVSHACFSCLAPRNGTKEDYKNHVWVYNDPHAFGSIVLAYAQAIKMGIRDVTLNEEQGALAKLDTVKQEIKTYVKYVPERRQDIAWENDRISFRYYGPPVRDQVGSGIDVWTKKVDYSIIDKWYRLNSRGEDYHVDRGEGADFYNMGFLRGVGGSAIWKDDKPYPSQTYANHQIIKNEKQEIEFALVFDEWDVDGKKVSEQKNIKMINGTNFFQISSTVNSQNKEDLIIGIGLTTFGKPILYQDSLSGVLSVYEKIDSNKGSLGTAVIVNPKQFVGYKKSGNDEYILIKVKPNQSFYYYIGAGWDDNCRFKEQNSWLNYVRPHNWEKLNKTYKTKLSKKIIPVSKEQYKSVN
ncbi:DUF4861 family protein [Pedobacter jamesrossensis]|uniref:DUF4861 family protein n=1 Tax=Pedobacter jamesrossensis TaxID=1908238 RepID=A0ABV8NPA5_9SPHI